MMPKFCRVPGLHLVCLSSESADGTELVSDDGGARTSCPRQRNAQITQITSERINIFECILY